MPRFLPIILFLATVGCSAPDSGEPASANAPEQQPTSQPDRGTPAEALALLQQAVTHYEEVGREQALADFTGRTPPFVDRDLYVFCYGPDRRVSAHPDSRYIGDSVDDLRDITGKAFALELWNSADQPEGGQVDYVWVNPTTSQPEPKVSFSRRVGEDVCAVGAYQP